MPQNKPLTLEDLLKLPPSHLLLAWEVAGIFRVDPKTVARWAKAGKLEAKRTVGGHRRYLVSSVLAKLDEEDDTR